VANLRHVAFVYHNGDANAIAFQIGDSGVDLHCVAALAVVLLDQFLLQLVQHQPVEHFAFRQSDVAQYPVEVFVLDGLVARQADRRNGRALAHVDNEDVALAVELYVLEEPCAVQLAQCRSRRRRGQQVAAVERQVAVNGALGNSLQSLDPDIGNDKGFSPQRGRHPHQAEQNQRVNSYHCFRSVTAPVPGLQPYGIARR